MLLPTNMRLEPVNNHGDFDCFRVTRQILVLVVDKVKGCAPFVRVDAYFCLLLSRLY